MGRIDVHHHYVTASLVEALDRAGVHDVGGLPLAAHRPLDSLPAMDRYEIDAALLSVPVPLAVPDVRSAARALNEAGAEAVPAAPTRRGRARASRRGRLSRAGAGALPTSTARPSPVGCSRAWIPAISPV